jgi:hypothetical protein
MDRNRDMAMGNIHNVIKKMGGSIFRSTKQTMSTKGEKINSVEKKVIHF